MWLAYPEQAANKRLIFLKYKTTRKKNENLVDAVYCVTEQFFFIFYFYLFIFWVLFIITNQH